MLDLVVTGLHLTALFFWYTLYQEPARIDQIILKVSAIKLLYNLYIMSVYNLCTYFVYKCMGSCIINNLKHIMFSDIDSNPVNIWVPTKTKLWK